jgi:poly [ADP-ribose] polymerase
LEDKGDLLDLLRNMCYMSKSVNKGTMEKYYKLETKLTHVQDHKTVDMIQRYMKTNVGGSHNFGLAIESIYEINKPQEAQAYRKWDSLHNKQLLWHGTRLANAVGILSTGFRINPVGVPTTGKMFGNGLYFANASTKSAGYMGISMQSGYGLLFLCEIALGNMHERLQAEHVTTLPDGRHSTKGMGCWQPETNSHVEIGDVTVPIGKLKQGAISGKALQYDEFIVYDTSQIKMRYVMVVKYTSKW